MSTAAKPRQSRRQQAFKSHIESIADRMQNKMFAEMYTTAVRQAMEGNSVLFDFLAQLERTPVSIEEFLDSKEFFGATDISIWPEVRRAIIDIYKDWWKGPDVAFSEAVLMGATGTGKSTIVIVGTAYDVYLLSCLRKPQQIYGLPSATSIVFPILGAKPNVVNKVIYAPMRKFIESMPYFQKYMMPSKLIDSEMYFEEKNIRVIRAGGDEDAILGEAVIGGGIDEINFMQVVQKSKKAEVSTGRAGLYDQAHQIHNRMVSRKKGRFTYPGPVIGRVFASSSTRYKGDFTDRRKAQVRTNKIGTVYIYDRKQYEVAPPERYSGMKFRLLIANEVMHDTRVLEEGEVVPAGAWVEEVPIEYIHDFRTDPHSNLRDVLGISSNAISPFIKMRHRVYECAALSEELGLESFLLQDHVVLGIHGMPMVRADHYCMNPGKPRYVHIDLSQTGDRCGIAMLRYDGLIRMGRPGEQEEMMPLATVEMACTIQPDPNNEILIAEIRSWVKSLKTKHGYPIRAVTYDGFDSRESIQAWRAANMPSKVLSVDRSSVPYKQLRDAMYDKRIILPNDDILLTEITELEYDADKDKIDHPVVGSKDLSDAVCGAYSSMLERKSTWQGGYGEDDDPAMAGRSGGSRYEGPRR